MSNKLKERDFKKIRKIKAQSTHSTVTAAQRSTNDMLYMCCAHTKYKLMELNREK